MFTVNRIYFNALFSRTGHYKFAACNKSFLVCKSDIPSCFDRGKRRKKSDHADNAVEDNIGLLHSGNLAESVHSAQYLYIRVRETLS